MDDHTTKRTRPRIPPRRRRRQRTIWRNLILPALKVVVVVSLIAATGVFAAGRISRPIKLLNAENRETQQVASSLTSLREENAQIERQIKYLKTPRGKAQAARKLGYVKPGEITLVLPAEGGKSAP